jgi:hypothetical protein
MKESGMSGTVIPFRPRPRFYRTVDSWHSARRRKNPPHSLPLRMDACVRLTQLMQGLQAVGLACRREAATGVYVIGPK